MTLGGSLGISYPYSSYGFLTLLLDRKGLHTTNIGQNAFLLSLGCLRGAGLGVDPVVKAPLGERKDVNLSWPPDRLRLSWVYHASPDVVPSLLTPSVETAGSWS